MKCRIVYKPDGQVSIIHPAPKARRINVEFPKGWRPPHTKKPEKAAIVYSLSDNPSGRLQIAYIRSIGGKAEIESDDVFLERVSEKAVKAGRTIKPDGTMVPGPLEGLPFEDVDPSTLPQDRKNRDKWRGKKGKGIKVDPSVVTVAEKRQAVEDELDTELAKASPDSVQAIKLQRKLDKRDY